MDRKPPAGQTTITVTTSGYPAPQQPYIPAQSYVPPPQYVTAHPAPPISNENWLERNQRNKPQSNSVGAAALIFITGGMTIAWTLGFTIKPIALISFNMQSSWFIGGIIGAFLSAIATNYVPRKFIHYFASFLVVIGGIIFISTDLDYNAVMASRYLNGIANGMVFVTSMLLVGEESILNIRGQVAASIDTVSFCSGIFIQIMFVYAWDPSVYDMQAFNKTHGGIILALGILAVVFVALFMIESPIFYLQRNQEQEALDCLRRLKSPADLNAGTYAQLEEHKRYVSANNDMSLNESIVSGLPALFKLCCLRAISAMTYSVVFVFTLTLLAAFSGYSSTSWILILFGTFRLLGALTSAFIVDPVGRKVLVLLGTLVSAGMCFGLGRILAYFSNLLDTGKVIACIYFIFIVQIFAGSYATASSAYISEAFPLAVKPYYIAFSFIVEMIVALCMFKVNLTKMYVYYYVLGSLSLAYFVFAIFMLPETKQTSLREAQAKFRKIINGVSLN